jgi:hypothetical protein
MKNRTVTLHTELAAHTGTKFIRDRRLIRCSYTKKNYSTAIYSFLTTFNENAVISIVVLLFQYITVSTILLQSQFVKPTRFTLDTRML